jgi:hypothetical protein
MKNLIVLAAIVLSTAVFSLAQKSESFDIATFKTPKGWQKEIQKNAVQFGAEDANGGICMVTLFKSVPGSADPKSNFDSSWETIVKELVTVSGEPEMNEAAEENGWTAQSGLAPYESEGKKGIVMLVTLTGNKNIVNILILTNTANFQDAITGFLGSIVLPKVERVAENAKTTTAQVDQRFIGRWNRSSSVSPLYADPASWGTAGYTKSRYEFRADGTYLYTERSFSYSFQNILIVKESGTYAVSGNQITVTPGKSVIEAYSKRNGADELGTLVKSQKRALEAVTYQYTFHYFSGIKEWNLVFQAASPTQRDGQFSTFTLFPNAWYFDQKFTDTDLTSARGN